MTYASTLALLSGATDDALTLTAAARLARDARGVARCLLVLPMLSAADWAFATEGLYMTPELVEQVQQVNDEARRRAEGLLQQVREAEGLELEQDGGRLEFAPEQSAGQLSLRNETPLCDLMICGQSILTGLGMWSGLISDGLLGAHAPLLVLRRPLGSGVAAIAWDGGDAAGRAVRGALPLLRRAEGVVVVQDPNHIQDTRADTARPERLVEYLRLHGVAARYVQRKGAVRRGGIAALAREEGAATLVAGAFSRSRLLEELVGGCTEDLLDPDGGLNLLLAH